MHGIVAWDESLNPTTNLITWQDRRLTVAGKIRINLIINEIH